MVTKVNTARIKLWNQEVGAVTWLEEQNHAIFEFNKRFLESGFDVSPLQMSLKEARNNSAIFSYPNLNKEYLFRFTRLTCRFFTRSFW